MILVLDVNVLFTITEDMVNQFCEDNEEPLPSEMEMIELGWTMDDFIYHWIGEALFELREQQALADQVLANDLRQTSESAG